MAVKDYKTVDGVIDPSLSLARLRMLPPKRKHEVGSPSPTKYTKLTRIEGECRL